MLRLTAVVLLVAVACGGQEPSDGPPPVPDTQAEMTLESPAFEEGGVIPEVYSCNGDDVAPSLVWSGIPDEAVELVLVLDDPDAPGGTFTHWTVFGIDPASGGSPEGGVPDGGIEGVTTLGRAGYGGPCPPPGPSHTYVFTLAALSEPSGLDAAADPAAVAAVVSAAPASVSLSGEYPG